MSFINPCLISISLSSATIVSSLAIYGNIRSKQLYASLNDKQRVLYDKIKIARLSLYIKAYLFSIILSMFYTYVITDRNHSYSIDYCIFSLITHVLTLLIYKFYPKDDYLEDHLTAKQKVLYNKLSSEITYSYILGIIGAIGLYRINTPFC